MYFQNTAIEFVAGWDSLGFRGSSLDRGANKQEWVEQDRINRDNCSSPTPLRFHLLISHPSVGCSPDTVGSGS